MMTTTMSMMMKMIMMEMTLVSRSRLLLEYGADVEALDSEGWSPFHWACQHGNVYTARLLMTRGGWGWMGVLGRGPKWSGEEVAAVAARVLVLRRTTPHRSLLCVKAVYTNYLTIVKACTDRENLAR